MILNTGGTPSVSQYDFIITFHHSHTTRHAMRLTNTQLPWHDAGKLVDNQARQGLVLTF
jgi:hypothetical protein